MLRQISRRRSFHCVLAPHSFSPFGPRVCGSAGFIAEERGETSGGRANACQGGVKGSRSEQSPDYGESPRAIPETFLDLRIFFSAKKLRRLQGLFWW